MGVRLATAPCSIVDAMVMLGWRVGRYGAFGALLVLGACAGPVAPSPVPPSPLRSVHTQGAATVLARALVQRAVLPPGSTRSARLPVAALKNPPQSVATPNLVDVTRFAVVPGTMAYAFAYVWAHRPAGMTSLGSGSGSNAQGASTTSQWVSDAISGMPPGVDSAMLLISVAPAANGTTALRVDAQVTWAATRPRRTTVPPADRVAVVSITETAPQNQNPGLPAPRRVVVTSPSIVSRLAMAANELGVMLPGTRSCPADVGTSFVVAFAPSVRAAPNLTFTAGSCSGVVVTSPGHRAAFLSNDQAFTSAYQQALGIAG